jgi:hypothetical protein
VDFLEFVQRSEWPIIVGATLWIVRRPLVNLFERLNPTKVDAWGFSAEFEKTLNKIDALTPAQPKAATSRPYFKS